MDTKNVSFFELDDKSYLMTDNLFLVIYGIIMRILTIIMISMLIIYYHIKKVIMNMLLDIMINVNQHLHHYN